MWFSAAGGDMDTALVTAVWAFLGIVVTTLGTIAVQALRNRSDSAPTSTTPAVDGHATSLLQVARDVARDIGQLDQRADDNDYRDEIQDRRLDALERYNEHRDPDWKHR